MTAGSFYVHFLKFFYGHPNSNLSVNLPCHIFPKVLTFLEFNPKLRYYGTKILPSLLSLSLLYSPSLYRPLLLDLCLSLHVSYTLLRELLPSRPPNPSLYRLLVFLPSRLNKPVGPLVTSHPTYTLSLVPPLEHIGLYPSTWSLHPPRRGHYLKLV